MIYKYLVWPFRNIRNYLTVGFFFAVLAIFKGVINFPLFIDTLNSMGYSSSYGFMFIFLRFVAVLFLWPISLLLAFLNLLF